MWQTCLEAVYVDFSQLQKYLCHQMQRDRVCKDSGHQNLYNSAFNKLVNAFHFRLLPKNAKLLKSSCLSNAVTMIVTVIVPILQQSLCRDEFLWRSATVAVEMKLFPCHQPRWVAYHTKKTPSPPTLNMAYTLARREPGDQ